MLIDNYDAGVPEICPATDVNVLDALVPTERTALKQITMISDNITAYSTAVGPSSDFRKRFTFDAKFFIASSESSNTSAFEGIRNTKLVLDVLVFLRKYIAMYYPTNSRAVLASLYRGNNPNANR
jgi:hypothetical protein